jgi:hypothetical protein
MRLQIAAGMCIAFLLTSCVKTFVADVEKYNEALVVDGNINDGPGPYTVKLSKSSRAQEFSSYIPYKNCTVTIQDELGNKVTLQEKGPGIYQTDSASFKGVPGRSYQLQVTTAENEKYESAPELLRKGVKIQSVYAEREHKTDPKLFYGRDGYQFYVDAEAPATNDNYLFWRMQCAYKFKMDYPITYYYDHGLHPVLDPDTLRNCFRTVDILDIFLLNTNELQQTDINRFPINYEDNYTKALSIRYSLNVSQLTISENAFNYWSTVKKMRDAGGELYTQQPYQIPNNLKCITHPDKPALGYFMAAGISEKRIFLNPDPFTIREGKCILNELQFYPDRWFMYRPDMWPVFYTQPLLYLPAECLDCRKLGTLTRPKFWVD